MILGLEVDSGLLVAFVSFGLAALFATVGWTLKQAFSVAQAVRALEEKTEDHERRIGMLESV